MEILASLPGGLRLFTPRVSAEALGEEVPKVRRQLEKRITRQLTLSVGSPEQRH